MSVSLQTKKKKKKRKNGIFFMVLVELLWLIPYQFCTSQCQSHTSLCCCFSVYAGRAGLCTSHASQTSPSWSIFGIPVPESFWYQKALSWLGAGRNFKPWSLVTHWHQWLDHSYCVLRNHIISTKLKQKLSLEFMYLALTLEGGKMN